MIYQISSGQGPAECELGVAKLIAYLQNNYGISVLETSPGYYEGTFRSARFFMKPPFKSCQAAITLLPSRASLGFPAIGMRRRCPSTVSTPICTKTGRTTRADKTS